MRWILSLVPALTLVMLGCRSAPPAYSEADDARSEAAAVELAETANARAEPASEAMEALAPFVGRWEVHQLFWDEPGAVPDTTEFSARVYFVKHGQTLAVDEIAEDGVYRFLGFHTYDATAGGYVNWGVSDAPTLAWGVGQFVEGRRKIEFRGQRVDPRSERPSFVPYRGIWEILGPDEHLYTAVGRTADGEEFPVKTVRYTRQTEFEDH